MKMNPMDKRELELKSSAYTLSDMEIFVFPELMLALVLANIMSPRIWQWRSDKWFGRLEGMKPYRRILRLKQFVMDHYAFNLDLDTWGLTTKQRELARFRDFVDMEALRQSNALFGYEGDKYYFDLDIRRHFGLDKYDADAIPYWKTETVEAMDAFKHRPRSQTGAGECVSLAALYAAALFIVARIPLASIFMMATPLHSQNFIDIDDGILTNNRRLVTKPMWFNGTALSAQARRALEHERVTLVAHETGWIHTLYPEATIEQRAYADFSRKLRNFLHTGLTAEILGNFIRHRRDLQKCFYLRRSMGGRDHYISAERVLEYERDSANRMTDSSRARLLAEIDSEEFSPRRPQGGIILNDLEKYVAANAPDLDKPGDVDTLAAQFACGCLDAREAIAQLVKFCHTRPSLPDPAAKRTLRQDAPTLGISPDMPREDIIARIADLRPLRREADLAFYAYRDLNRVEPEPFLYAAMGRSPVSIAGSSGLPENDLIAYVQKLPDESIYDGDGRLAQPDEVWNFGRGDGAEKAILLANLLAARNPDITIALEMDGDTALLRAGMHKIAFRTRKRLGSRTWILRAPGRS